MDRWVPVHFYMDLRTCSYCGEEDFAMETNGLTVRIAGERCKYENGLPLTEWELNVPSGKLVVANDLRDLFPLGEDEDAAEGVLGHRLASMAYAAGGLSHGFVGNSCPGVYKVAEGSYKIVNPPRDEWYNGKEYVTVDPPIAFEGERVAGICTDVWWYSIADYAEFRLRVKHFEYRVGDFDIEPIHVKPGVYRFRQDEEACRHEGPDECVYTRFEWVREPDPAQDFLGTYSDVEVTPHAFVQAQVKKWPTLYGKQEGGRFSRGKNVPWSEMTEADRLSSWQRVADHIFCTLGGGTEWHEKGFPTCKAEPDVPDVEPPSFRQQYHWYPFSDRYGGLFEPRKLAPGFAKLAFRVLESVISFGMHVNDNSHSREVRYTRQRMMTAVKRYRELAKQYPKLADSEYVKWLGEKGRAEAWVKEFPLGPEFTKKHKTIARSQRWVPKNAYAVVFDARKLKDGHFAWHPKQPSVGGCWANKADAQRYALNEWHNNKQPKEHNCFWTSHARNTSVPLYSVARVVKVGEVSHMGETLVEIQYDYGTPWMQDTNKRKALVEAGEKAGIRVLTKGEYKRLLPKAVKFFEDAEAAMGVKKAPKVKKTARKTA